jgi:hypothetical protein
MAAASVPRMNKAAAKIRVNEAASPRMGFPHGVFVRSILNPSTLKYNPALEKYSQKREDQL